MVIRIEKPCEVARSARLVKASKSEWTDRLFLLNITKGQTLPYCERVAVACNVYPSQAGNLRLRRVSANVSSFGESGLVETGTNLKAIRN